jgi:V/A-type H+-transporting ATPase subunit K
LDNLILALGWAGLYGPMALGAIGSIIGCALAGQAACGALLETETGHGRYVGIAAMPSSQTIYGIVVMFSLNREVNIDNAPGLFAVGILAGLALLFSVSIAPAAIVEGFAVFAFIFALVISAGIPA